MSVYFVTCREANAVKIGSSLEPHARLSEIQWGCPFELRLEAILPGGHEEEFAMHARFEGERIRGEWFRLSEMIEAIIEANPAPSRTNFDEIPQVTRAALHKAERQRRALAEREAIRLSGAKFSPRLLTREQRKRVASGDITFPFRGKTYA